MTSLTAIKTLSARAQMALQGSGGPDSYAPQLMAQVSLLGPNIPGSGIFTKVYLFCQRLHFYMTGRIFADQMSYFGRGKLGIPFGEMAFLQVRTCWLDDCVETFFERHYGQETNLVILGAGYDSRCRRLFQTTKRGSTSCCFEVDAPATQAAKLEALEKAGGAGGIANGGVTYIPCDFESQDWMNELSNAGTNFDKNLPTFFVWEGVTPYLDRKVVLDTIQKIAHCGKGSAIAFDYFDKALLDQTMVKAAAKATTERWKFGLDDRGVEELQKECNEGSGANELIVLDHLKADELIQRYCAKHYNGKCIGFLQDFGGFLLIGSSP